jgi:LPXTG-motif cell wall-anchored protein
MAETDPDELERRITRTRTELAQTVDAIADRVSPKKVAQRTVADVKARVGDALGLSARPVEVGEDAEGLWDEEPPSLAPVLVGVGAALVVGALIVLWRRRRRH